MLSPKVCQFSTNGHTFIIDIVKSDSDRIGAYNFMQDIFRTNEPITRALQSCVMDTSQIFADICANCFQYDLSLMAKDNDGKVIAIALNALCEFDEQQQHKSDADIVNEPDKMEFGEEIRNGPFTSLNGNRLSVFINWVERHIAFLPPEIVGRAMKLEILAVHPQFSRIGLASNLVRSSIQLAHSSACSHLISCATAVASQNLLRKFGFKTVQKVPFHNFLENGVPIFAEVHDKGEAAELMLLSI